METRPGDHRISPAWWPAIFLAVVIVVAMLCAAQFTGSFTSYVPVMLTSPRSGLVMESGAKVQLRGVQVGRVEGIDGGTGSAGLRLQLFSDQVKYIPANVVAEIKSTTVFGAKYVDLIYPEHPSAQRISAGAVLSSRNVTTEVNTVFQNLVDVLHKVDADKLSAVLTALADGVRGQGQRIGEATTATNDVLLAVNPRMDAVREDWRALRGFSDTYSAAARDILAVLDNASTTGSTITAQAKALDTLLLNTISFANTATGFLASNQNNLVDSINVLRPTTELLRKYNPTYTCLLMGAKWFLDNGGYRSIGGNGRTVVVDATVLFGSDPYRYPDNLPIVNGKGGPGGKPGCGSLPDASKMFPVRQLVTDTGWGTGMEIRPNPGIGFPGWLNFFPVTRAVPEPPSIRYTGPPAPGPATYPGGPPYGAPQYGPDGAPLYPPPPR